MKVMTKKTLDIYGGIGSILAALVCVWFALGHDTGESMWKVWVGFSVLLVLNGIAMILHALRDKTHRSVPAHPGH